MKKRRAWSFDSGNQVADLRDGMIGIVIARMLRDGKAEALVMFPRYTIPVPACYLRKISP